MFSWILAGLPTNKQKLAKSPLNPAWELMLVLAVCFFPLVSSTWLCTYKKESRSTWPMSHAPRNAITLHLSDEDESEVMMTVQLVTHSSKNTLERMALCKVCAIPSSSDGQRRFRVCQLKPFFPFRDELNTKDGIIMNAVIPQSLQSECLQI